MGKPSSNCVSRASSHSNCSKSSRMNVTMSASKTSKRKLRKYRKMKSNIKKLFTDLRNNSTVEISDVDSTVINLERDTCANNTSKRKLDESNSMFKMNKRSKNDSLVLISDEPHIVRTKSRTSLTPCKPSTIQCSTPINKKDSTGLQIENCTDPKNNNTSAVQNFNEDISNITKEINDESYVTIDLTTETLNCSAISKASNTVIELDDTVDNNDCTVVSVSNASSMSNDSEVTVLYMPHNKGPAKKGLHQVVKGLSNLNASKKGKMLEYIVTTLLNGCEVPDKLKSVCQNFGNKESPSIGTTTIEDTYIREMITGQTSSRNSIGSNVYNPGGDQRNKTGLRMVVIDGSNVAMEHGKGKVFSVKGLKICIDYFLKRGHVVKAFVPRFRCKFGKSTEPRLLDELERRGLVVYTPSREIGGRFVTSYDDRYIVQCAAEFNAVIVSGDNYRDLLIENQRWRPVIENRLLPFTWVDDMIMFPRDPLGRHGPTLEKFLKHSDTNLKSGNGVS